MHVMLSRADDESAQGVIEFAVIAGLMLLVFLGTVDFARFLYYDNAIRSSARVGAELVTNHCLNKAQCGLASVTITDDFIIQSTYCDAQPYVKLRPAPTGTSPCQPCSAASGCVSNCDATCKANNCKQDICVDPPDSTRTGGSDVTVTVGYNFRPLTALMSKFFTDQSCWGASGGGTPAFDDPTVSHHTLCVSAVGRVQ